MTDIYKVLIADDHPFLAKGIKAVLEEQIQYKVVALAEEGEQALALFNKWLPQIVVLDIDMPIINGIELADKILKQASKSFVVIITNHLSKHHIAQLRMVPVSGVIMKSSAISELLTCLHQVTQGERYFSEALKQEFEADETQLGTGEPEFDKLTPSETDILRMIAQGMTTREIADDTSRSERTIEKHRFNIRDKLNIRGSNGMLHFLMEYSDRILK